MSCPIGVAKVEADLEPERLSDDAAALIEALLPLGSPGREQFLAQVPHAVVVKRCGCGCVTVDLEVDRSGAQPAVGLGGIVAEADWTFDTEVAGGLLLFAQDGYLSGLEAYSVTADSVTRWPLPRKIAQPTTTATADD